MPRGVWLEEIIVVNTGFNRGRGAGHDPCRCVMQFWTKEGVLLGEVDPLGPVYDPTDGAWKIKDWMKTKPEEGS